MAGSLAGARDDDPHKPSLAEKRSASILRPGHCFSILPLFNRCVYPLPPAVFFSTIEQRSLPPSRQANIRFDLPATSSSYRLSCAQLSYAASSELALSTTNNELVLPFTLFERVIANNGQHRTKKDGQGPFY